MADATSPTTPTSPRQFYRRPLPESCLSFSCEEGKQVFAEALAAGYMNCYFGLAAQFRTQDEPAFCGLSTLVMVLNTLEVDPKKVWKGPWRWYHENMLDCCVPLEVVKTAGINLQQFACLAVCNTLNAELVQVNADASEDAFRETVKRCTQQSDEVIVASYSRKVLKQTGDGHFSPIGGYHPGRDLVLVLDTARFKYPPYWISVSLLWQAMQALDKSTDLPRGYFVMSKANNSPLLMFRISPHLTITLPSVLDVDDGVSAFCQKWEHHLCWNVREQDTREEKAVVREAVLNLLDCLKELKQPQDSVILCTQIDICCARKLSGEHCCAMETLLTSLEKTTFFETAVNCIKENPELATAAEKSGRPSRNSRAGFCLDDALEGGHNQCALRPLDSSHFVTMLLLSWPSQRCNGTMGQIIQKTVSAQLAASDVVLQNEVSLLRQQFESLLGYRCLQCSR